MYKSQKLLNLTMKAGKFNQSMADIKAMKADWIYLPLA